MTREEYLHELKEIAQIDVAVVELERKKRIRVNALLEKCLIFFKGENTDDPGNPDEKTSND